MKVIEQGKIELEAGDKVACITLQKGYLIVVTERGFVFQLKLGGAIDDGVQTRAGE